MRPSSLRERDRPRPDRVPVEPPVELGRIELVPAHPVEQREHLVPARRVVRQRLDAHFDDVPSAAFKQSPRVRACHRVLEADQVARAGEHELERPRGIRLDVVAVEPQRVDVAARSFRYRRERDLVARLADQAEVDGLVVRLGALHVRERPNRPAEPLLEPQLREHDLARRLVDREVGERTVADAVRLDADARRLELRELAPVHGRVDHPARRQPLLVRQRPPSSR